MDAKKYTKPNLPTTQNILEDLADTDDKVHDFVKLDPEDDILSKAYKCFQSFDNLHNDSTNRSELQVKLEELNQKLVESIEYIKTTRNEHVTPLELQASIGYGDRLPSGGP